MGRIDDTVERRLAQLHMLRERQLLSRDKARLLRCAQEADEDDRWWRCLPWLTTDDRRDADPAIAALRRDVASIGGPAVAEHYQKSIARRLIHTLRQCHDRLPPRAASSLGLTKGATYAQAAQVLSGGLRLATTKTAISRSVRSPTRSGLSVLQIATRPSELPGVSYSQAVRWLTQRTTRHCRHCGGEMPPRQHRGRPRLFCSDRCRQAGHRERLAVRVATAHR